MQLICHMAQKTRLHNQGKKTQSSKKWWLISFKIAFCAVVYAMHAHFLDAIRFGKQCTHLCPISSLIAHNRCMSISVVYRIRSICMLFLHTRTHWVFWSFRRTHVDFSSCWSFSHCIYISNQLHTHKIGLNFTPRQKIDLITNATVHPPLNICD